VINNSTGTSHCKEKGKMHKITLVHGTFAANSDWVTEDESSAPEGFRGRLKSKLGEDTSFCVPKPWGSASFFGKYKDLTNSARLNGAENLKQELLQHEKVEGEKHFLLAHSHGGNVAMYALQDKQVQQRVDGLICMATPFLFPRRRPLSIATLVLSLIIMVIGVIQFLWSTDLAAQGGVASMMACGLIISGIIVPALLIWMVSRVRYKQNSQNGPTGSTKLQEHIDKLSYVAPNIPILLIRSSGDEASGLLRGTQFLNWLGGMVMRIGGRQIYLLICVSALLLFWMAYRGVAWIPSSAFSILNVALMCSAAIMVVMLAALTLSRIVIGFDAWRWVGELETMIEDGPPGIASDLLVITPRQSEYGLAHTAVYTEPETTDAIANWCKAHTGK